MALEHRRSVVGLGGRIYRCRATGMSFSFGDELVVCAMFCALRMLLFGWDWVWGICPDVCLSRYAAKLN